MNQNTLVVTLINTKEKIHTFYQEKNRYVAPILKGLLMLAILVGLDQLFPFGAFGHRTWILGILAVLQAFIPVGFLYYIASAVILLNLWKVGFDICIAFLMFVMICTICFFRIDNRCSYLAALVPVLCFCKLGILVPAVLAMAVGMEAFVPVCSGVIVYYFSLSLKDALTILAGTDGNRLGVGVAYLAEVMLKNQTFFIVLAASCLTVIVTSLLYKLFHENAWLFAAIGGNAVMAFAVIVGTLYFKVKLPIWMIIIEMLAGLVLCFLMELIRGIGDVTRIEKTVFEDDEYIYYVKAVPKIKVTQSEPNVKNMNESLQEEELSSKEQLLDELEGEKEEVVPEQEEIVNVEDESLEAQRSDSEDTDPEDADLHNIDSDFTDRKAFQQSPEEEVISESAESGSDYSETDNSEKKTTEESELDSDEEATEEDKEKMVTGDDTDEY